MTQGDAGDINDGEESMNHGIPRDKSLNNIVIQILL